MCREIAAGLLQKNQCRQDDEELPEGLAGRTPHWVGKIRLETSYLNPAGGPTLMNDKHYDFFNEYKDICTPSETLREYDVVFLSLEELPKLKSDIDGAHVIKWINSAEKPDCMLAIVPKSGISERYKTVDINGVKNIKLKPV